MKGCHLDKDSSYMFLLQKTGVLYFKLANYAEAIDFTKQSIQVARYCIANHSSNTLSLVDNYSNLLYFYDEAGEIKNKYDAIDSCILYALKGGNGFDMAIKSLSDKTDYLFDNGEYSLCNRDSKLGEDLTQKYYHGKDSIVYIVSFVTKQAEFLYFSKQYSSAEKLLDDKIFQFKQTGNSKQLYAFYSLLGLISRDEKKYAKALNCFQQAFKISSAIKYKTGCAQNLVFIATLYEKQFNHYDTGLQYCARSLKYADAASDSLSAFRQMANIYVLKAMYDKAQYFFQRAFNTVQQGMNETTILQNSFQFSGFNLLQDLSDLVTDKGDAYVEQYYHTKNDNFLKNALGIYKKGDQFLAKIKTQQQLQFASNLVWRSTARNLYEHAIEACYANNNIEDAFYFFEKSRAILLNDQINEQRWMSDTDIAKQATLKKAITELERGLAGVTTSSKDYLAIQNNLNSSYAELGILIHNIKNKSPVFYQNYLDTVFITVNQLRKDILSNSKILVEIFSGDNAVYALTVTPNDQSLVKINKQLYDSLTNSFNSLIANRERLNKHFKNFIKTAYQLYSLLFQNKAPSFGSIIISPDGAGYPFEALVMNEDDKDPRYFLNQYAISYTYSAKYLTNRFAVNTNARSSILGMAPVQYKNYQNLSSLSGSDNSLENINSYFKNVTNYISEKATRNNFQQNFPGYTIIQLYTHAADSSINNEPVIYFADSALYLSDLVTDRKPITQLIVLSACETANGKLYQGEGIFSFNRGFAALGIPAAVSNLWSVDNLSTYRITELFYKYLSQGLPTDIALQKAKIEFINTSSSEEEKLPYFWAGSILTGKVGTLTKTNPRFPWSQVAGATILLIAMTYLTNILLHRKRRQV